MTAGDVARWTAHADRFTRLRWVGIGLFVLAALLLVGTLVEIALGVASWGRLPLAIFGLGLALGSFGAANDTAVHAMDFLARHGLLPERHAAEYAHERATRPERLPQLHASPRVATILPLVDAAVLGLLAWRLLHGGIG